MGITPSSLGSIAGTAITGAAAPSGDFAGALGSAMKQVNDLQATADQKVTSLLAGNGQDVHAAALSVERASLAFDLMLQVRNKVVSAYQEISRLQF
ncbi:MAG: flagellar hook-basal body complex protein FliE [Candidatus Korobacteraceae bacterium]|jgi:flagellar hook-basal body complex protein FliE